MDQPVSIEPSERMTLAPLFAEHRHLRTCVNAVLQGYCGVAHADGKCNARVAKLVIGPLSCGTQLTFFGGDTAHPLARKLIEELPADNAIWLPNDAWHEAILRAHGERLKTCGRYSFSGDRLDIEHLHALASAIPEGIEIKRMDVELARRVAEEVSPDQYSEEFGTHEEFVERGVGFCAIAGERIICGAISGSMCDGHIEIQVNTTEPYRRKGIAAAVCATLVTYCMKHGLEPHWDADNGISVNLAKKLGYVLAEEYDIVMI